LMKIKKMLFRFIRWILTIMLIVLSLVIIAQIGARYLFHQPLVWSEELALVLMVWITFLGSAIILDEHNHISIDFLVEQFSERIQTLIITFGYFLILLLNISFIIGGWRVVKSSADSVLPGMQISVGWLYGGIFVGGILATII